MTGNINFLSFKIKLLKKRLLKALKMKGRAEREVLELADQIDNLLNEYYQLSLKN